MSGGGAEERRSYRAPRGIRDVLPDEIPVWERLEETASRLARARGYREIRPPLLEDTALFIRSVGEVTDIVSKEMFTVVREKSSLTLRPEGTAGIVRAYVEAGFPKNAPIQRLFNIGPMFRYERPQKGRERMFTQFDVEAIGSLDPRLDAEIIQLAVGFFEELGLTGLEVRVNSMGDGADRDAYREALRAYLAPLIQEHCALCQERFERNVLRVLDCKNPACQELHADPPRLVDHLSVENGEHFERVRALLSDVGRETVIDSGLVRGLDYYTRTVFEVHASELGARSAICGGGRYDHLVRDLGGPDLPAVGFAIGFTGTILLLRELGLLGDARLEPACAFVVAAGDGLESEVFQLAEELRAGGVAAIFDLERKSLKAQMKTASKGGHRYAVILGPDELERGVVQLKDLRAAEQSEVARADLVETLVGASVEAGAG